ncbi:trehalose phosphatase/synthase 11 [Artemisia annua]|uniref:Trehalose phosphatase/synthase 11 n=1 Tax=Artemisia annua TaxID=35608 RepID=A0A2U1NZP4_ARTAN|nr:trehalose phosphatase/synthase 11 [Artemisia annua]
MEKEDAIAYSKKHKVWFKARGSGAVIQEPWFKGCGSEENINNLQKLILAVLANLSTPVLLPNDLTRECATSPSDEGVSNGVVVESTIAIMQTKEKSFDFVLCIGDDQSDENIFERILSSVVSPLLQGIAKLYSCTVSQNPTMAKYFIDDTVDEIKMFHGLEAASNKVQKSAVLQKDPCHFVMKISRVKQFLQAGSDSRKEGVCG